MIEREDQGKFFWELRSCVYWHEFSQIKIVYPDIYEHQSFAIDKKGFLSANTTYFIPTDETWLCGVLNSKLIEFFYQSVSNRIRGGYLRAFSQYIKQIPVVKISSKEKRLISELVDYVCLIDRTKQSNLAQDKLMLEYFEQIINGLVYELYLPEDLHTYNFAFADPLQSENLPALNDIQGNKIEALRAIFQRLYAQDHPIRRNLFLLDTIPVIRIIEGKA